jgi:tagatose-1,6-bisphosphate aldolase
MMLVAPLGAASTEQAKGFICGRFVWNAVRHDEATRNHFLDLRILVWPGG